MKANSLQPAVRWAVVITASLTLINSAHAASKYNVLHYFGDRPARNPWSGLVADSTGNLYGTTLESSADTCGSTGCGAVFKLTRGSGGKWSYNVIHRFTGTDGRFPSGNLIFDPSGNLYGTTIYGGTYDMGTVFELSPSGNTWTESVLASLGATSSDVGNPRAGLTFDSQGNLYGTADVGGANTGGGVYELRPSGGKWQEAVIYSFGSSANDGFFPNSSTLVSDSSGNLYGTTEQGGQFAGGVVFQLSPSPAGTWTETVLYSFTGGTDGSYPQSGVVFGADGNLYGTAFYGGDPKACTDGCGTVFQLTPSMGHWAFSVVLSFDVRNGASPLAGLTPGSSGNLYGTTFQGAKGNGVVFRLTKSSGRWTERVIHVFDRTHGAFPGASLMLDQRGTLYGSATQGGKGGQPGYGLVFSVTP